jgi:hypothetical protein
MYSNSAVLGLDISTSITGATVLDPSGSLLYSEAWDTRNKKHFPSLYHKAAFLEERIQDIKDMYPITDIFIEQSLQSFRSGFSSAKTLSTLSRFNGIVSWQCYKVFKKEPKMLASSSARKRVGIKLDRTKDTKRQILDFYLDKNPSVVVEYTHKGNPKPRYKDIADSWVIAKAGLEICLEKNTI